MKQNKATVSSTTLQQQEKKVNETKSTENNSNISRPSKIKSRTPSLKSSASLSKPVMRKASMSSFRMSAVESDRAEYEFVEKQVNPEAPNNIRNNNQKPNNISDLLQYGDVFFRCDSNA